MANFWEKDKPAKSVGVAQETAGAIQETVENVVQEGGSVLQSVVDQASQLMSSGAEFASDAIESLPSASQVSEAVGDIPSPLDVLTEGVSKVTDAVSDFGTSEFRFFAGNLLNAGGEFTQDDLNDTDIETLKKAVAKAQAEGRSSLDYGDFGTSEQDVLKGGPLAGLFNPELRLAQTLGGLNFSVGEEGNVIIRNTYNFNKGKKREAYWQAKKAGDDKKALEILTASISNPVEAASLIGYAKQESLKEEGKPFETEMVINLGKV